MIAGTQYLVKYFLFEPFNLAITLNDFEFFLLVLSMVSLAAAGNIINDIYDQRADLINKPEKVVIESRISESTGYNWFIALNVTGVGIGFYLSSVVGRPSFAALFILPSAFLYLYATQLKSTVLVGNLVVSLMVAMIIVMVGIFDLLPAITPQNKTTQRVIFSILIDYGLFALVINFLREMIKDQEDISGDYNAGYQTLPILLGRKRTNKIIFLIGIFPLIGVVYYIYNYLFHNQVAVFYVFLLIVLPMLYFLVKIPEAKSKDNYRHLSMVLKGILAAGLLSIGLYRFILL